MPIQISCVVLSYNGGDSLIRTLESCKLQTYPYKDLVIADDASTDNGYTVSVIEKWLAENSNFFTNVLFIKNSHNIGIVKNIRNASLQAQGEILFGLGQGDLAYAPDTLEVIASEIEKQRLIDPVDPFFWLGEYLGYKVEDNGELKIIQLYKDLPHQHRLLIKNPYRALKRNLIRWEIGGIGTVYHKKFYDDCIYPLTNAPRNWEDGPTFIWALSEGKKIGILGINIKCYEVGTGISWAKSSSYYQTLQYFLSIVLAKKVDYYLTNCRRYQALCEWLKELHISNNNTRKIIHRYYKYLQLYFSDSIIDRILFILIRIYHFIISSIYKIGAYFYYNFVYKNSEANNMDIAMQFIQHILCRNKP